MFTLRNVKIYQQKFIDMHKHCLCSAELNFPPQCFRRFRALELKFRSQCFHETRQTPFHRFSVAFIALDKIVGRSRAVLLKVNFCLIN